VEVLILGALAGGDEKTSWKKPPATVDDRNAEETLDFEGRLVVTVIGREAEAIKVEQALAEEPVRENAWLRG